VEEHAQHPGPSGAELVSALVRWQRSGGTWRVVGRRPDRVTVALLRCDGGEEVDRLSSGDPRWLEHLGGRDGSED
jgi:hypothetical protein